MQPERVMILVERSNFALKLPEDAGHGSAAFTIRSIGEETSDYTAPR